ncbi:MAG TPA: acetyl-CoA C-acyltransferase [Anaerolineales bacterium]|nr:acetyl-CoA C-acyltransferase [Anaerolineales bacterium]
MTEVVIVDAIRTPVGALGGVLSSVRPDDMAAHVIKSILERNQIAPALIEEVFMGCANQAGEDNRNVARMAALLAGLPVEVGGVTVNRLCASGLNAINMAARAIKAGEGDVYIAGGVESMSRAPYSLPKAEAGFSFGNLTAYDTALGWRYPNPKMKAMHGTDSMGETAENIAAERPHITREKQDEFSARSHSKAIAAIDSGRFKQEIVPVSISQKKGDPKVVDTDERPRRDTTVESLAKLKAAFRDGGTVTAGNSSGLNDGASALLMMSEERAKTLNLKPLARIVTSASAGVPPRIMGIGPVPATKKALERAGLKIQDVGLMELNEAFAIQSLAVIEDLSIDPELVNVNGGAIAIGHPLGCSGARLMTTLVHEMKNRGNVKYGVATLCVGVGQGEATVIEYLG